VDLLVLVVVVVMMMMMMTWVISGFRRGVNEAFLLWDVYSWTLEDGNYRLSRNVGN
jgi:hypothetical protein